MVTRREDLAAALTNVEENDGALATDFVPPSAEPVEVVANIDANTDVVAAESRARDEAGRFAPKTGTPAAPNPAAVAGVDPVDPTSAAPSRPEAPKSWKPEFKATWEKLDPTIAGYISQREQEMSKGIEEFRQKNEPALTIFNEIAPYVQEAQQRGVSPQQFVAEAKDLFYTRDLLFKADPQTKLQTIVNIAHAAGLPLAQMLQGQVTPEMQQALHPSVMALQQRLQQIEGTMTAQQQAEQTRQQQEIDNEIASFSAGDSHPHFQELMPEMARLLQAGVASDLDSAYSKALRLNDGLFQQSQTQQREAAEKERRQKADAAAKAARSNAVSTRTATPGAAAATTVGAPKGRRAALEAAFSDAQTGRI